LRFFVLINLSFLPFEGPSLKQLQPHRRRFVLFVVAQHPVTNQSRVAHMNKTGWHLQQRSFSTFSVPLSSGLPISAFFFLSSRFSI
jgi:hypothetical protein